MRTLGGTKQEALYILCNKVLWPYESQLELPFQVLMPYFVLEVLLYCGGSGPSSIVSQKLWPGDSQPKLVWKEGLKGVLGSYCRPLL